MQHCKRVACGIPLKEKQLPFAGGRYRQQQSFSSVTVVNKNTLSGRFSYERIKQEERFLNEMKRYTPDGIDGELMWH